MSIKFYPQDPHGGLSSVYDSFKDPRPLLVCKNDVQLEVMERSCHLKLSLLVSARTTLQLERTSFSVNLMLGSEVVTTTYVKTELKTTRRNVDDDQIDLNVEFAIPPCRGSMFPPKFVVNLENFSRCHSDIISRHLLELLTIYVEWSIATPSSPQTWCQLL
jgi:hypothetical protein